MIRPASNLRRQARSARRAFTLIEMLVVIAIIGILAGVGIPKLAGFGRSNATIAATRQLLDDLAFARGRALSSRSDVYVVFIPQGITTLGYWNTLNPQEKDLYTNLLGGQFTTYAIYTERSVGDQPGRSNPRYITEWKTLSSGAFIALSEFTNNGVFIADDHQRPLPVNQKFPFPTATNQRTNLPFIKFNHLGQVVSETNASGQPRDVVIALARGSIFYARDVNGKYVAQPADVRESPVNNSIISSNHIHLDWLTGRTRVERQELQ